MNKLEQREIEICVFVIWIIYFSLNYRDKIYSLPIEINRPCPTERHADHFNYFFPSKSDQIFFLSQKIRNVLKTYANIIF